MDSLLPLAPPVLSQPEPLQCCCGSEDCVALIHNGKVVDGLDKDARAAAQLGQNLLARHNAFIAEATRDREDLTARIAFLEAENACLETLNTKTAAENRALIAQIDTLSSNVAESDSRIHALEASLHASQQSVRRLEIAASRAEDMERHISELERDLEGMQGKLFESEEGARSAMGRWRAAERAVQELQDQMERMERGAREEAERQAEVIARLERQRELSSAAVRLKGAAAVKSLAGAEGSSAVSSFVRDLLQDNACLQVGIAELRELLASSREEIQTLRECLADQQPAQTPTPSSLREELGLPVSPPKREEPAREVHIHHHYHAAPRERKKKRRSALFMTPSSSRAPSVATMESSAKDSSAWSPRELEDSLASSPQSDPRTSVFDRPEEPLSPSTSVGALSPAWKGKRPALITSSPPAAGLLDEVTDQPDSTGLDESLAGGLRPQESAPDSGLEGSEMEISEVEVPEACAAEAADSETPIARSPPRTLRRAQSHESVVSLGGLDIHTLRSRPSQLTLGHLGAHAVLADVTARPTISGSGGRGSSVLRDNLASLPMARARAKPAPKRWNWRPWKAPEREGADSSSVGTGTTTASEDAAPRDVPSSPRVPKDDAKGPGSLKAVSVRAPGINQPGAVPWFGELMAQARRRKGPVGDGDGL
ncbi:hypothetical protein VUR80DRAFT_10373 [Thermomyces stellatus]